MVFVELGKRGRAKEEALESAVHARIPGQLEAGAGVGLPPGLVEWNQPLLVLDVGFQFDVRCEALDHIKAEVGLRGAAGIKSLAALSLR
jgi:hypothetical protein